MIAKMPAVEPAKLPTPAERPDADVVIYDGQCRFCTAQVRRLARWDTRQRLAFLSLHDPSVRQKWPDLTHEMLMREMVVVDPQGNRHRGAAGFRYLTRRLPRLWILAPIMNLPGTLPIWQWFYRRVANRRYLFGKVQSCEGGACSIHRP